MRCTVWAYSTASKLNVNDLQLYQLCFPLLAVEVSDVNGGWGFPRGGLRGGASLGEATSPRGLTSPSSNEA